MVVPRAADADRETRAVQSRVSNALSALLNSVTGGGSGQRRLMGGRRMNRPTQLRTNAHLCVIMRYNANLALAHQRKEV
jgi:hypothetical protein